MNRRRIPTFGFSLCCEAQLESLPFAHSSSCGAEVMLGPGAPAHACRDGSSPGARPDEPLPHAALRARSCHPASPHLVGARPDHRLLVHAWLPRYVPRTWEAARRSPAARAVQATPDAPHPSRRHSRRSRKLAHPPRPGVTMPLFLGDGGRKVENDATNYAYRVKQAYPAGK